MSGVGSSSVPMGQVTGERDTKSGISKLGRWGRRPEDGILRFCFLGELPRFCGMLLRWDKMSRREGRVTPDTEPSFWCETSCEKLKRQRPKEWTWYKGNEQFMALPG